MSNHYDYIIAGGGMAGLSLCYHLLQQPALADRRILLIDRERRSGHDRTWSFWEKDSGPFESLVHHRWSDIVVANRHQVLDRSLAPYSYKLIRSTEFYEHVYAAIAAAGRRVTLLIGEARDVQSSEELASVRVGEEQYTADYLFSSLPPSWTEVRSNAPHYLDQHFRGWFIKTVAPAFQPHRAHLMDFRTDQHGETRFLYVLPTSSTEALVEVAIFSNTHLRADGYDRIIADYLRETWKLAAQDYEITFTEMGNIPMTDYPFTRNAGRVISIGMAGGGSRPATGYTFLYVQRRTQAITRALATGKLTGNAIGAAWPRRHHYYDATILHLLQGGGIAGSDIFTRLFARNPAPRVLAFLNGESSLLEEQALMRTTPISKFGPAFLRVMLQ